MLFRILSAIELRLLSSLVLLKIRLASGSLLIGARGLNPLGHFWLARRYGTANVLTQVIGERAKGFSEAKPLAWFGLGDRGDAGRIPLREGPPLGQLAPGA